MKNVIIEKFFVIYKEDTKYVGCLWSIKLEDREKILMFFEIMEILEL